MAKDRKKLVIDELVNCLEIPETAYDKTQARYEDLSDWLTRPQAHCARFDPYISPQGSFRLGTVTRAEEYDLDFGCRLREGISKARNTQEELKTLVGKDLEEYRQARGIEQRMEEKSRCWRLKYKDELAFHMDVVPSIPQEQQQRRELMEAMLKYGADKFLAQNVTQHAGAITDNRLPNYRTISPGWRVSNSEGYALWFESRMKLARQLLEERALAAKAATVDELPARKWKSPLQKCVQILKCHRDQVFADNPDAKPISVIVTTLAGDAYQGEPDVASALEGILAKMGMKVRQTKPRVPNPVNPQEDFADKWYDPEFADLELERNFWDWLEQAQQDFKLIGESADPEFIAEQVMRKFGATLNARDLRTKFGIVAPVVVTPPKSHVITEAPARPWTYRS